MLHLIRSGHGQPLQGAPAWPLRCSFCAFGVLCQDMIDAGLEADVSPKGSRRPVDRRWVSDVPPPSQTFMGIACHGMSRHVHRTSRGDLPAGPAGCRHRAAGLGAAASEDGMQTALQTCGARDGPANLGDGPELLEPASRTVHFCGWPFSHPLAIEDLAKLGSGPKSSRACRESFSAGFACGPTQILLASSVSFFVYFSRRQRYIYIYIYIYTYTHPDCQDGGEVHPPVHSPSCCGIACPAITQTRRKGLNGRGGASNRAKCGIA